LYHQSLGGFEMSPLVRDVMSKHEITISKSDTIQKAASLMKQHDIGFLPVIMEGKLIGVITDRDLVIRGIADNIDVQQSIDSIFSKQIICCTPDTSVEQASKLMAEKQVHRLLITENEQLVGVLTLADLAREVEKNPVAGKALSGISQR
jgi:CBS domain-containing protein